MKKIFILLVVVTALLVVAAGCNYCDDYPEDDVFCGGGSTSTSPVYPESVQQQEPEVTTPSKLPVLECNYETYVCELVW